MGISLGQSPIGHVHVHIDISMMYMYVYMYICVQITAWRHTVWLFIELWIMERI